MRKTTHLRHQIRKFIIVPIFIVYGLIFSFTFYHFNNNAKHKAFNENLAKAKEHASTISEDLNNDIAMARSLAQSFEGLQYIDAKERLDISNNVIKSIAESNPIYKGVWYNWQLFSLDSNYTLNYGRHRNTYFNYDGYLTTQQDTLDLNGESGLFKTIHALNDEFVTNPYYEDYEGKLDEPIMETSICVPIQKDGLFVGLIGFDISLERYQSLFDELQTAEGANILLFSNNGHIIASKNSEWLGKSVNDISLQLPDNTEIFQHLKDTSNYSIEVSDKEGTLNYLAFSKITLGNSPDSWCVAYSIPVNNVLKTTYNQLATIIVIGLLGLIIITILLHFLVRNIVKTISQASSFAEELAKGNLTTTVNNTRRDEIGVLIEMLKNMSEKMHYIVSSVVNITKTIKSTSGNIENETQKLAEGAAEQAASMEEISSNIAEIMNSAHQNANNSIATKKISDKAAISMKEGLETVHESNRAMTAITEKISAVKGIAFQTNILALNASVEAARAGESGRGFSVVAGEVRKLAERTQNLTDEIEKIVSAGLKVSNEATEKLDAITPEIIKTAELVNHIASSSEDQSTAVNQINSTVIQLNEITQQNAQQAELMNQFIEKLSEESLQLSETLNYFNHNK